MSEQPPASEEQDSIFQQCLDGAKWMWAPGTFVGAKVGARAGQLGAIAQGSSALGVMVGSVAKGTAYGALITTALGCVGNIALQNSDVVKDLGEGFCNTAPQFCSADKSRGR